MSEVKSILIARREVREIVSDNKIIILHSRVKFKFPFALISHIFLIRNIKICISKIFY